MLSKSLGTLSLASALFLSSLFAADDALWVADFNDGKLITKMGGGIGAWQFDPNDRSSWCEISISPEEVHFGEPGSSMKIEYNVQSTKENFVTGQENLTPYEVGRHGEAFNGVYMLFDRQNVTPYKYLAFSARGDAQSGFSRKFKIEFKDQSRAQSSSFDKLTDRWQTYYVALDQFGSSLNLSELKEVVFVFDRSMTRTSGVMYVDDIYFTKRRGNEDESASALSPESVAPADAPQTWGVTIDGDLAEWRDLPKISYSAKNMEFGTIRNKRDLSGEFQFQWDERYLYLALTVKDNEITQAKAPKEIYQADVVELFIDPKNDGLVWNNPSDFQIGFAPMGPNGQPQSWAWFQGKEPSPQEVLFNSKRGHGGYTVEAAISWDFLGVQPFDGMNIGASPAIHDTDIKRKKTETKLNWRFSQNPVDPGKFNLGTLNLGPRAKK